MKKIIGLTVQEFQNNYPDKFRVTKEDGYSRPITCDFKPDRYNFEIVDGVIINFTMG